jgi:hypothetical protein
MANPEPRPIYEERLGDRRRRLADLEGKFRVIAHGRLAVFVLLVAVFVLAWKGGWPEWTVLVPAGAFAALVLLHDRVIRARDRAGRAAAHYERGLRRIDDAWAGDGAGRTDLVPADHPFAFDLDLFGRGSLFDLLSTARTRAGEAALARWLVEPAEPAAIRARQAAVEELRPMVDLREELGALAEGAGAAVHPDTLLRWAEAPPLLPGGTRWFTAVSLAAGGLVLAAGVGNAAGLWPYPWLLGALLVSGLAGAQARRALREVRASADRPSGDLEILLQTMVRLESAEFRSPSLKALKDRLASHRVTSLLRRMAWLDAGRNMFSAAFVYGLLVDVHAAVAVESWRVRHGGAVRGWLEALGEIEALVSLSGYAFEHPADPFPEILEGPALFEGRGLGHPLVPGGAFVRNDVALRAGAEGPALLLVSGSNMSGKSTALRTVGVNAVLAQCGAPVRAQSLRLTPLALGATLHIHDSLHDGRSRFMAELERLRVLSDRASGPVPLLFLLDEVLAGTNSHDRRQGAEALLASFVARGAVGMATTHDLSLSDAIRPLGPRARDVHFEDRLEGGRLVFDYVLREGVVRRSNAVDLMRAVGLPV